MSVRREEVENIARVARLHLSEEELDAIHPQMEEILKVFSSLNDIDTEDVKPSFHPIPIEGELRDDKVGDCLSQEEALQNTELKEDQYFKGPRIV